MRKCFNDAWKTFYFIRFLPLQNTNLAFGPLLLLDETRRDVLYVKAGTAR